MEIKITPAAQMWLFAGAWFRFGSEAQVRECASRSSVSYAHRQYNTKAAQEVRVLFYKAR